jgi:3-methyladenine DNA glycosylase AlkD
MRAVRREFSRRLRDLPSENLLAIADVLVEKYRWVAYELIYFHPKALGGLDVEQVKRLGRGIDSWGSVDPFGRYISGPAWQRGLIPDDAVRRWAQSEDRYWRRAALVSTVPLNLRAAGGKRDTERTLDICRLLVADRDDTVVKAMSWALRELLVWDPNAVRQFLEKNKLAARVNREVRNKLDTGVKNPKKTVRETSTS